MLEFIGFGIAFLISVFISGFFLWIGLKVIGKNRGVIEAGLANFAAGIFAIAIFCVSAMIPFLVISAPLLAFLAYLYGLKTLLKISMFEAFIVSVVASIVFTVAVFFIAMIAGIYLFSFAPPPYSHMPKSIHF